MWNHMWKKLKSEFHVFGWFPGLQNLDVFKKMYYVAFSFSGRNNSLELSVFGFSNSLSYGLAEAGEWRALISWALG